ncbi:MAG: hypothetical protein KAT62_03595 [Desulfuromonadales bacterium]|nr:hypothetical protein [Desulfuromonadales bacterium]
MKAEQFFLTAPHVKANLINRLVDIECDGKIKVVLSDAGSKSVRQRGLQWRWYTEVAKSGVGGKHESTKDGVHLLSKWKWGIPILLRDDEFFSELFAMYKDKWSDNPERMEWFVESRVHTEAFSTSQMAEFLTDFQRHYAPMVDLTDPDDLKLMRN